MKNRIIKFRAWTGKKMLYPQDKDDKFKPEDGFNKLWYRSISSLCGDDNDYEWMQFTGLKDKNGKEIYENDIVEGNPLGWTGTMMGKVIWMNDGWYVDPEDDRDNEKRLHGDFFSKVEVKGNVYMNPELIK